jgi:biotin operon repressor
MAQNKEMKRLRERLEAQGFAVERVPNGHYRVTAPSGAKTQIAATPRSGRGVLNMVTRLKRIGYDHRAA